MRLLEASWGHLGDILGAFWGPFRHILGVRNALGSIYLIKGGELFSQSRFWDRKMFEIEDFWSTKSSKIEAKMAPKKVRKKKLKKKSFF